MKKLIGLAVIALSLSAAAVQEKQIDTQFMVINATTKEQRTKLANLGIAIERVEADYVTAIGRPEAMEQIKKWGWLRSAASMKQTLMDYPKKDQNFHNFDELIVAIEKLEKDYPNLVEVGEIGRSLENRPIPLITISGNKAQGKAEIAFMGGHHAREHLSVELPLMLAQHLTERYVAGDQAIRSLVDNRVIHIIPIVNPDGAEHDIASGKYQSWRKNRRANSKAGSYGVDLNRNYGHKFGTIGASADPDAETYHGPYAFSEPETQAIKNFVQVRNQLTMLISFHTFSELILYPWGHKYDPISQTKDRQVFETMAQTMAKWNGYKPQQSSELYRTSGDTSDWAYGVHGIFSFTFELDPKSMWEGGFYPGQSYIDVVFNKNLQPALYLIEYADSPYRVLEPKHTAYGLSSPLID